MKTKILVTGSHGQLAKTIEEFSKKVSPKLDFVFTSKAQLDISNSDDLEVFFKKHNFDYCINCAAYTNVELAENEVELAYSINSEAVCQIAKACNKYDTTLIHISTDYVFDGEKHKAYLEEDRTNPINIYGKSKLEGEEHVKKELKKHFIIRTSWLYSIYGKNFVKTIINKVKEKSDLKITTAQTGTPTSCKDLMEFILFLIEGEVTDYGLYHFSAKGETNWYKFALEIAKYFPEYTINKIESTAHFEALAKRPKHSVLDNNKAQKIFKKTPFWKESLRSIVEHLKQD